MEAKVIVQDLVSLDRDIARAHAAQKSWRRALSVDPEANAERYPLENFRHLAAKSVYDALGDLAPFAMDLPWRDALQRWVLALLQARLSHDADVALERARHAKTAILHLDPVKHVSFKDSWRGVVEERSRARAIAHLNAASEAGDIAGLTRDRSARRIEVARRLGLTGSHALFAPAAADGVAFARAFLGATDDLWLAVWRDAAKRANLPEPTSAVDAIHFSIAREAGEGWPAHLAPRWLAEMFESHLKGISIDLPALPAPLGASSFLRALEAFGRAFRAGGDARPLPFAIARAPYFTDEYRVGIVFGALGLKRVFYTKQLGTSARIAELQVRMVARTMLVEARLRAMRSILTDESRFPSKDLFEELTHRVLGAPMPPSLVGAWPSAEDDEPARMTALATALPLARELVDRFDDDWFRNPRAFEALRSRASLAARDPVCEPTDGGDAPAPEAAAANALARVFEEALA
jgi:hypothetical protein